ncbi:MAG: AIM24 family protein [Planctomycetaceae bacterium]
MQYEILSRPAASVAKLSMDGGESVTCEVGAMIAMTTEFEVETTTKKKGSSGGRLGKALKRMFAGENLFLNHFTATDDGQSLIIGPHAGRHSALSADGRVADCSGIQLAGF